MMVTRWLAVLLYLSHQQAGIEGAMTHVVHSSLVTRACKVTVHNVRTLPVLQCTSVSVSDSVSCLYEWLPVC